MHTLLYRLVRELNMEPLVMAVLNNLLLESMRWLSQPMPLRAAATAAVLNNLLHAASTKRVLRHESVYVWELRRQPLQPLQKAIALYNLLLVAKRRQYAAATALQVAACADQCGA